jgi:HAD superfamily hydrolase (TIGR01549 family)
MAKAILFDFDGVLVNTIPVWFKINKDANPALTFEEYKEFSHGNFHETTEAAVKNGTYVLDLDGDKKYKERLPEHSISDELKLLIQKLQKEYLLFVVSSGSEKIIEEHLEREALLKCFQGVFGHESHKSKEEKIRYILSSFSLPSEHVVFVTDTTGDVVEGQRAGVSSIGVTWGLHEEELFKGVNTDKIVNTVEELESAIQDLLQ